MIAAIHSRLRLHSLHHSFFTSLFPLYFFPCDPRLPRLCRGAFTSLASSASSSTTRSCSPLTARLPRDPWGHSPLARDNPFRIRTYKKTGEGVPPKPTHSPRSSASPRYPSLFSVSLFFSILLTTQYSLLTLPIFCLSLVFLLSSPPNTENANVSE
jgi:hypothetical protein